MNAVATAPKPVPLIRSFSCPNCGAAVKVLTGGVALSAACGNCGSAVDTSDPNLQVLGQWADKLRALHPLITLGNRGTLKGVEWQCIGFMQRMEQGSGWQWDEYLLFNPYHGFRWLTFDHGHWSFITMIKDRPLLHSYGGASFRGLSFRLWANATVKVTAVLGEFYWKLAKDETVMATDYISPPFMLSQENYPGGSELIFSLGEYIEPSVIGEAFGIENLPWREGIGAHQPNPWKERFAVALKCCLFALLMLVLEQFACLVMTSSAPALKDTFIYQPQGLPTSYASQPFELGGFSRGVSVRTAGGLSNGSVDLRLQLVNEATQKAYPLGQTLARFSGWTAEHLVADSRLSNVPPGRYRLIAEPSNFTGTDPVAEALPVTPSDPQSSDVTLTFTVGRSVGWGPFAVCFVLLLGPTLLLGILRLGYEGKRWANSDVGSSVLSTGSSDDDDN